MGVGVRVGVSVGVGVGVYGCVVGTTFIIICTCYMCAHRHSIIDHVQHH